MNSVTSKKDMLVTLKERCCLVALGAASLGIFTYLLRRRLSTKRVTYEDAGVSVTRGNKAVSVIKNVVQDSFNSSVIPSLEFAGGITLPPTFNPKNHVLLASIGGVGTKTKFLFRHLSRKDALWTMGQDIVHHSVNDILVHNGRPLCFLDYLGTDKVMEEDMEILVASMAEACKVHSCPLIGGETAEMKVVYGRGNLDVVGCIFGYQKKKNIIDGSSMEADNVIYGLPSYGPHTNGYTLLNKLYPKDPPRDILLPHRSYYHEIINLISVAKVEGLVHITDGGWFGNIRRIIPSSLEARFDSYDLPPLYLDIQSRSNLSNTEMMKTFNCGIGMMAIVKREYGSVLENLGWVRLGFIRVSSER